MSAAKEIEAAQAHAEEMEAARETDAEELHRLLRENDALKSHVEELKAERDALRARVAELEQAASNTPPVTDKPIKRGRPKGSRNKAREHLEATA